MMESITIYPKSEAQKSLLKSLLKEMKVHFEISKSNDETLMTEEEFHARINESIQQAKEGKVVEYTPELRQKIFGSIL